jgi:flagellar assembly protein FliH
MSSLAALTGQARDAGFVQDGRFALVPRAARAAAQPAPPEPEPEDPVALAFAEGFNLAAEQVRAELEAAHAAEAAAREALSLSLTRLDADMAEMLRQRLTDTVMALCEATLVPYAHDEKVLAQRVERAVAMFSRAEDERVIRLHPDDLALVTDQLKAEWKVVPDPALERGSIRVESQSGGVEDGPAQWRRALAEAFHAC